METHPNPLFLRIPFLRVLIPFVSGILLGWNLLFDGNYWWMYAYAGYPLLGLSLTLYLAGWFYSQKSHPYDRQGLLGLVSIFFFFIAGYLVTLQQSPFYNPQHLAYSGNDKEITVYECTVVNEVHKQGYGVTMEVKVTSILLDGEWKTAEGKMKLFITRKAGNTKKIQHGSHLRIEGRPTFCPFPRYPFQDDYYRSWRADGTFYRHSPQSVTHLGQETKASFWYRISHIRKTLQQVLQHYIKDKESLGIIEALLLGDRTHMGSETKERYAEAGAMHVLALSGLHVGLLYSLLLLLFALWSWLINRYAFYPTLSILILYLFALISGLSPSVLRAVGMLSLVLLAKKHHRQHKVENLLTIVAFVLLLHKPLLLFDLGFQLSFTAVSGILIFYRPFVKVWQPKNRAQKHFWELTSVSLTAQTGVLPLALYYFHTFPTYFLLGNWVMVPLTALLLYIGSAILLFSWWEGAAHFFSLCFEAVVKGSATYLEAINSLPGAKIGPFYYAGWQVIAIYSLMVALYIGIKKRNFISLCIATALVSLLSATSVYKQYKIAHQHYAVVYDTKKPVVAIIEGQKAFLFHGKGKTLHQHSGGYESRIRPSLLYMEAGEIQQGDFGAEQPFVEVEQIEGGWLYHWHGKHILIVTEEGFEGENLPPVDLLVVRKEQEEAVRQNLADGKPAVVVIIGKRGTAAEKTDLDGAVYHYTEDDGPYLLAV